MCFRTCSEDKGHACALGHAVKTKDMHACALGHAVRTKDMHVL